MTKDQMNARHICIAGKNDIAVEVLDALLKMRHVPDFEVSVICNRSETGFDSWQKSLRHYANVWGVPEITLDVAYGIENLVLLSLEYDRIIKPSLFTSARLYNVHFSLLPAYKGMYTSVMPLLNDEQRSGVTLHVIREGIDTGEIIDQTIIPISQTMTSRDLYFECLRKGADIAIKNMPSLISGTIRYYPQPREHSSYYPKGSVDFSNTEIRLNDTAYGIGLQIRALTFKEYQMPTVLGYRVAGYEISSDSSTEKPGTILEAKERAFVLATIDYDMTIYVDDMADDHDSLLIS